MTSEHVPSAIVPTYARADVTFERGDGCWLTSTTGERYLDFGAGIAVVSLGHSHPHLVETLKTQGSKLWHTSNLFQMPEGERLAHRLADATFADLVFFANSGAEANEAAIKMARKWQTVSGHPERFHVLTFEGAFHGRTLATIAAGGQAKYLEGFGPKVDGFDQIPITTIEDVEAAIGPGTGAIMIEPIQGEGGVRVVPRAFLRGLRELCDKHKLLLIFDEVQTGVGRTGKLFAYELTGVTPDILTSAKGLGGVLAPGFLEHVAEVGSLARQRFAALKDAHPDIIEDVRGEGLMMGLKLKIPPGDFAAFARAHKLLSIPAGDNVLRLIPPLVVTDEELGEAVQRLDAACRDAEAELLVRKGAAA